nr:hypothetical protein [Propionicimonas sp.]
MSSSTHPRRAARPVGARAAAVPRCTRRRRADGGSPDRQGWVTA